MQGKITLITSPDIFENDSKSILFMHLDDAEQDAISIWLKNADIPYNINFYVYTGEPDINWLFYTLSLCKHKYINLDNYNNITNALSGYILSKDSVFYKTTDDNLISIYSHINHNRITNIEQFLETTIGDHTN